MSDNGIMRRPTDEEQRIIGAIYRDLNRLRGAHHHPVAVGMSPRVIQDPERGRWSRVLGLPVVEIRSPGGPGTTDVALGDVFLILGVEVPE